jgi:chromosomal replication initiation ATPase DnaA
MRFDFPRIRQFSREQFVVSDVNREAAEAVDLWPAWVGARLALIGPPGSGKSHLAQAWAARTGAWIVSDDRDLTVRAGPVLFEDADRRREDTLLFHLLNRAGPADTFLITARTLPRTWPVELPDLRSRLNALPVATIGQPDDRVLEQVLVRLFRERDIRPDAELLAYLVRRIERSVPAAEAVVAKLDVAGDAAGRAINRTLAREILEDVDNTLDLFE